jgi:lambda family phage portal protein
MSLTTFLDSAILSVAPVWGAQRIAARRQFEVSQKYFGRALEGAESDRHREGKWLGSRLSADAFLEEDLETARQRSRELYKNDFVGGAIDSRVEHVVGTGFKVQSRIREKAGVITKEQAKTLNQQLEDVFDQFETVACLTRKKSLWEKVSLACRSVDSDGETIIVMSDISTVDSPIPLCVEVIDCDRMETPPEMIADPSVRMGVKYRRVNNKNTDILGYYIRDNHPHDNKEFSLSYTFVPAWRVLHVFVEWFAGQSRGLPWMTRALNRAKDGKDLTEAGIIGAQVEACWAGFIKSKANPVAKAIGAATSTEGTKRLQEVRPGSINYIGQDDEIVFSSPNKANSVGTLQEYNNRTISAALNWPYEMLMKDWRGVSFAGGRIILNGAKISCKVRQKLIAVSILRPIWHRVVEESVIVGAVDLDVRTYRDNRHHFHRHNWSPPKWSYAINPAEEVKATILELDNNLTTLEEELGERQRDLEETFAQREVERAMARAMAIMPNDVAESEAPEPETQPEPNTIDAEQQTEAANASN